MKRFTSFLAVFFILASLQAQPLTRLPGLMNHYCSLSHFLAESKTAEAAAAAAELVKEINRADLQGIPEDEQRELRLALFHVLLDAGQLSATRDLSRQKDLFALLSVKMMVLAKKCKSAAGIISLDYCRMPGRGEKESSISVTGGVQAGASIRR